LEFIKHDEILDLLRQVGIGWSETSSEELAQLTMDTGSAMVRIHLSPPERSTAIEDGATSISIPEGKMPETIAKVLRQVPRSDFILIPAGKWREIFDAVAFCLCENEAWQTIDAAAAVELHTRDPLLCDAGEIDLLCDVITALLDGADQPAQGLMVIPVGAPLLIEIVPDEALRLTIGNKVLADELAPAYS
jgi:hypothetical protein